MAIQKRDRSFNNILKEVSMNTIPLVFVKRLQVTLTSGETRAMTRDELVNFDSVDDVLCNSNISSDIVDMTIELDHSYIEETVKSEINDLLDIVTDESNPRL